jgi:hypothetical protein
LTFQHGAHTHGSFAAYTKYYYVDEIFLGIDWDDAYKEALQETYSARDSTAVDEITTRLLGRLGDPFTRMLNAQQAKIYLAESQGAVRFPAVHTISSVSLKVFQIDVLS